MARVSLAVLLLSVGVGESLRLDGRKRKAASNECIAPDFLMDLVRSFANNLISTVADPINIPLEGVGFESPLPLCGDFNVNADLRFLVAGFGNASVSKLGCTASECVEKGNLGICRTTRFTFAFEITAREITLEGSGLANYTGCRGDVELLGRETTFGMTVAGSTLRGEASLDLTSGVPPEVEFVDILGAEIDTGSLDRFECGFPSLPPSISQILGTKCSDIGHKIVELLIRFSGSLVNKFLEGFIGESLDVESS